MKRSMLKVIALALCLTLLAPVLPLEAVGAGFLQVRALASSLFPSASQQSADLLSQAEALEKEGKESVSGVWRYVALLEENQAVVTGYDGPDAEALDVPSTLDDLDVVGLTAGALSGVQGLRQVTLPLQILAIGANALPRGAVVRSNSGVYVQKWAQRNGYAFSSSSSYDFVRGVVDLTGTLPEHFVRVSSEEIWLRPLEAAQVSVGTRFFLLDPGNLYQISYYEAVELSEAPGGFVRVRCQTPDVDQILNRYESARETMMLDMSTLLLADGASLVSGGHDRIDLDVAAGLYLHYQADIPIGGEKSKKKVSVDALIENSWTGKVTAGLFVQDSVEIVQLDKLEASLAFGYKDDDKLSSMWGEESFEDALSALSQAVADTGKKDTLDVPVGNAVVYSVAGIVNFAVSIRFVSELSGQLTFSYKTSSRTTYTYKEGEGLQKKSVMLTNQIEGSVNAKIKLGIQIALEVYLAAFRVAYLSLFAGIEAEAKYDFAEALNLLGAIAGDIAEGEWLTLDQNVNLNMLDLIDITIDFVAELRFGLGDSTTGTLDLMEVPLCREPIAELHYHYWEYVFDQEPVTEEQTDHFRYKPHWGKDPIHLASDCPYETKDIRFYLSSNGELVREIRNVEPGTVVHAPDVESIFSRIDEGALKFKGWYTSPDTEADTRFDTWPFTVADDMDFYAATSPYHEVLLVDPLGRPLSYAPAGATPVSIYDTETEVTSDWDESTHRVAEDEALMLPGLLPDGTQVEDWVEVESPKDLTILSDDPMEPGDPYAVGPASRKDITLLALTGSDIVASFYLRGQLVDTLYAKRGDAITAPAAPGNLGSWTLNGWKAMHPVLDEEDESEEGGTVEEPLIAPGAPIQTDNLKGIYMLFYADLTYNPQSGNVDPDAVAIGSVTPTTGNPTAVESMFATTDIDANHIRVDGIKSGYTGDIVDVQVPSKIGTKTVTEIAENAFSGKSTLRSLILPDTVTTIGANMVSYCPSLIKVDLSATQITAIPDHFAYGDASLVCVLVPQPVYDDSGILQSGCGAIGKYAFYGCRSLGGIHINGPIADNAFENCSGIGYATLGPYVTAIGNGAFQGCTRMTSIAIPESIQTVGSQILDGCTALNTLILNGPGIITGNSFQLQTNHIEHLVIGDAVEEIGNYALSGFTSLQSLTLPATLRRIGSNAFSGAGIEELTLSLASGTEITSAFCGMDSLRTLNITSGAVGNSSFRNLYSLQSVNIGADVIGIGMYAFAGCPSLTSVQMEEGLQILGSRAFENCTALESISLPDSLVSIGSYLFSGCQNLRLLSVGAALNRLEDNTYAFCIGNQSLLETIDIRDGADWIPAYAFANMRRGSSGEGFAALESVSIGSTVRSVGLRAFAGAGMRTLILCGSTDILHSAFSDCPRLEEVIFAGGSIGAFAFSGNTSLRRIQVLRGTIGEEAFSRCTSLESVTLGNGVQSVGPRAFDGCTALTQVDLGQGVRQLEYEVFRDCTALTSLVFPDSIVHYGTRIIVDCTALTDLTVGGGQAVLSPGYTGGYRDASAFDIGPDASLRNLTIREGVEELDYVFCNARYQTSPYGYPTLKTVTLPRSLKVFGQEFIDSGVEELVFRGDVEIQSRSGNDLTMPALRKLVLPGGSIGDSAFAGCTLLTEVELGNRVTHIGSWAFENCTSLKTLIVPDSVEDFGYGPLKGCSALETLSVGACADTLRGNDLPDENALKTLIIREGATQIQDQIFSKNLTHLETLSLPSTLRQIGASAFLFAGIKNLTISSEVEIGDHAFRDCLHLETVHIAGGEMGQSAFEGCVSLKKAEVFSGSLGYKAFKGCVSLSDVRLGDGVNVIDSDAFADCRSLKRLVIPDSVESYGEAIIRGCTGLESLSIGAGVPELSASYGLQFYIGPGAKLRSLELAEGITGIAHNVFSNGDYGFPHLSTVHFPASLQYVDRAFQGAGLEKIVFRGNTQIRSSAFQNMTSLESVELPGGSIGYSAFLGCTGLSRVDLGNGVTAIDQEAFRNCTALTGLVIPDSVTSLGSRMILGCTGLRHLTVGGGVGSLDFGTLDIGEGSQLTTLTVREGVHSIYSNAFGNRVDSVNLGHEQLRSVTLPSTLNTLDPGNLSAWPNLEHLYLKYGCQLSDTSVSPNLTIYTDYYNAFIDDFAAAHGIRYVVRGEDPLPVYTLRLVAPMNALMGGPYAPVTDPELSMGVEGLALISQQQIAYTEDLTLSDPETAAAFDFMGWYMDPLYTTRWNQGGMPASDLTLYARMDAKVQVAFAVNMSGYSSDSRLPEGFTLYDEVLQKAGTPLNLPEDPNRPGWGLLGWYMDPTFSQICRLSRVPDTDTVIYGRMEPLSAGAAYRTVDGGLELTRYTLMQGEDPALMLPGRVNGVPVVSIAEGAFAGGGVRTVSLPATVTHIAPGAFADSGITAIRVSESNPAYKSVQGVLYTKSGAELICCPPSRAGSTFTVPSGVTRIAGSAFKGCTRLTSITFRDGLQEIGASAFSGCTGLTSVSLPDSVTTLRANAFEGCVNLTVFTAKGLTVLESSETIETLPRGNGIRVYGPLCSGALRDYYTVYTQDGRAIVSNYNLYRVYLSCNGESETLLCEAGFLLPDAVREITNVNGAAVTGWYRNSVNTLWDLEHDVMPEQDLSLYAMFTPLFETETRTLDLSDGTTASGLVFTGWNGSGSTLSVPSTFNGNAVLGLDAGFFADAQSTQSLTIPSTVLWLDPSASYAGIITADTDSAAYAWAQTHAADVRPILYTLTLDANLGEAVAPLDAGKDTPILLPTPERAGWTFLYWSERTYSGYPVNLTDGMYVMPGQDTTLYAIWSGEDEDVPFTWKGQNREITILSYTGDASDVVIPDTINNWPVTAIADSAFEGTSLRSIDLGPVQVIGEDAFRDCTGLTRVVMRSVTEIGESAFAGCTLLLNVTLPDTLTAIGNRAFAGCSKLPSITIPDTVTGFGDAVFADCTGLLRVTLGTSVQNVDADTFAGCRKLMEVNVTGNHYASVGGVLFDAAGEILILYPMGRTAPAYTVPAGVETIGTRAFAGTSLTSVVLPESVTAIETQAFMHSGLTEIDLSHVTHLGNGAFFSCPELMHVVLGEGTEIGSFAFLNCPKLSEAVIPSTVTMDEDAVLFEANGLLVIVGATGSDAHTYALANGIAFTDPNAPGAVSVSLSEETVTMQRGETRTLTAETSPAGLAVTWHTNNPDIAFVDENGLVSAMGCGTAVITARTENGLTASCTVTVEAAVQQILLPETLALTPGSEQVIPVTFVPQSPSDQALTWTSQDPTIAAVDENGRVTALQAGTTTVTASSANGVSASVSVTVYTPVETLEIVVPEQLITAARGLNTIQLTLQVLPEQATFQDCLWTSSDTSRASVNDQGLVTFHTTGDVVIMAISRDPSRTSASVTLNPVRADIGQWAEVEMTTATLTDQGADVQFTVSVNGVRLLENTDYTASWDDITAPGQYTLTLTGQGNFTGTLAVPFTVIDGSIPVAGSFTLQPGQSGRIPVYLSPDSGLTLEDLTFASSNPAVLTVDADCVIRAVSAGEAYLTFSGGGVSATFIVTVRTLSTLTLPSALSTVEDEAFEGSSAVEAIHLGSQVGTVGSRAFANMPSLLQVEFTSSEVTIAQDAFAQSSPLIICPSGSDMEAYAQAHGLKCLLQ
ncbi:MAG: leucine-rich repeat protein [Clostridia bacterium]|nr:leucine-rich repeat protein [Clostridia bacterium]